jgi:hypothetical protein
MYPVRRPSIQWNITIGRRYGHGKSKSLERSPFITVMVARGLRAVLRHVPPRVGERFHIRELPHSFGTDIRMPCTLRFCTALLTRCLGPLHPASHSKVSYFGLSRLTESPLWKGGADTTASPVLTIALGQEADQCRVHWVSKCWQEQRHQHIEEWQGLQGRAYSR